MKIMIYWCHKDTRETKWETHWAGQSSVRLLAGAAGGLAGAVAGGPVEPAVAAVVAVRTAHTARSWHSTVSSTLPKQQH